MAQPQEGWKDALWCCCAAGRLWPRRRRDEVLVPLVRLPWPLNCEPFDTGPVATVKPPRLIVVLIGCVVGCSFPGRGRYENSLLCVDLFENGHAR